MFIIRYMTLLTYFSYKMLIVYYNSIVKQDLGRSYIEYLKQNTFTTLKELKTIPHVPFCSLSLCLSLSLSLSLCRLSRCKANRVHRETEVIETRPNTASKTLADATRNPYVWCVTWVKRKRHSRQRKRETERICSKGFRLSESP